ncbi:acyl transferase/acyl hydrolase/lysophospholipase [Xylaria digitata]|nr:acyl transferase/acyl hydrolase/lysophospholipase [Xylaria digitata]
MQPCQAFICVGCESVAQLHHCLPTEFRAETLDCDEGSSLQKPLALRLCLTNHHLSLRFPLAASFAAFRIMASPYKRPMFLSPSDSRSGNAVPQLTHPTFEDSSEDRFSDKARILCIDDNGYYTFPSLLILHHIMNRVKSLSDEPEARPCENFDLICGAGFGGILALFFGRLGMTVGQCENWFAEHRRKLMPVGQAKTMLGTGRKMLSNNKALEQAVKSAIRSVGLPEDTPLADPSLSGMHVSKSDTPTCRVFVLAMHPGDIHEPVRLRSYSSRMDPIAASCCIWEAAVATEASPSYYVPIKMGHPPLSYTSSGLGYCNPSKEGLDEAVRIWQLPGVRCLVSLGTGKIPPRLEHKSIPTVDIGIFNLKKFLSLINTISAIATDTQRVHNEITRDATLLGFKYFRFEGLEGVPYKSSYNASSLERISASVARYVQSEKASELLAFCARHLNSSRADDHWLSNLISRAQRPSLSPGYSNRSQNLSQERSILSFKSAPEIAHPSQDSKVLDSEHIPPTREKEDKRHIESSADEWIMRIRERIHPLVEKRHRDNDRRVKIAILDSGVDLNHPDIAYASRQVDGSDSRIKATKDWTLSAEGCHDINGHGTFCTALILEISPYADVHVAKVFDSGVATAETAGYVAEVCLTATPEKDRPR